MMAYSETVGACAIATLAAVNEGLGTCLHTIARPSFQDKVKEVLGVPERFIPVWNQLVGGPGREHGGRRAAARQPFEETFYWGRHGQPMERDPAPLPQRWEELRFLTRMYGYPED